MANEIPKYYQSSIYAMGTRLEVVFPGLSHEKGNQVFSDIAYEVKRLEKKLNKYSDESIMSSINLLANEHPVNVDEEIFSILKSCKEFWFLTEGAFDISISPLMKLWNIKHGYKIDLFEPSEKEIDEVRKIVGLDKMILDESQHTVYFQHQGMELDLGGFLKGYTLDKVKNILINSCVEDAFISFGESSILALGRHPQGSSWKTGINHMIIKGNIVYTFDLTNQSLSNSASTALETGFNNYGHIIDPKTGFPTKGNIAASIVSGSATEAEVLSSSLLVTDKKAHTKLFDKFPECKAVFFEYKPEGLVINEY